MAIIRNLRLHSKLRVVLIGLTISAIALSIAPAGCGQVGNINVVWFEATAVSNATILSQGPGRSLTLSCTTTGNGVPCRWNVRMLLRSSDPLVSWSQSLLGESGNAEVRVNSFSYVLTDFTTPAGGESFGPEPDLLVGTGASTAAQGGIAPGDYTLVQFELQFDNPSNGPAIRTILAAFGADGWTGIPDPEDQIPPLVQVASNLPVPAVGGGILPNAVIVIDLATDADAILPGIEICGDGVDNDGDGEADCDDSNCSSHPFCLPRPTIQCPANLTLECDGAGNTAAVQAWLDSATAESSCSNLRVTDDFDGLEDRCGAAGSVRVVWRATDSCGSASCSAMLHIIDTTDPTIAGPADLTFECDETGNQTELRDWLRSATADDVCGDVEIAFARGATSFDCSATIVWTATDDCGNTGTHSAELTIEGDTEAPRMTLNGAATMTLECGVDVYVELGATVVDDCDATLVGPTIGGDLVDTHTPDVYVVTYDAVDLCNHATPRLTRTVTVVDTLPPRLEIKHVELWPPNHEYVTLDLSDCARLVDDCDGELDIDALGRILSVSSDEPDNAEGDGNTVNDIIIVDDNTFRARAERQGGGNGRVYTIPFEVDDGEGHILHDECVVTVPHDQGDDDDDEDDDGDDDENDDDDGDDDDD